MNLPTIHNPQHPMPAVQMQGGPGGQGFFAPPPPLWGGVSAEQKLELLEYWRSITKRKWAILALVLAVAVLAGVISFAMTPIYRATATVLIEAGKGKVVSVEEVYGISQMREHYQTQVEILKSRDVALRTVQALKLWNHPDFDPRLAKVSWTKRAMAAVGIGDKVEVRDPDSWTEAELAAGALDHLRDNLQVTPVRLSQLVKVEFESPDRNLAARVANAVAQQYIEADREVRNELTAEVSRRLQDQLTVLRSNVEDSERALQAYREQKGIVSVGGSAQAFASQQMTGTTDRMLQARARRIELESSYQQVKNASPATYGSVTAVSNNLGVNDAYRSYSVASSKLVELQSRLGPAHDMVRQAQAELDEARTQLEQRQTAVVRAIIRDYEAARGTELALERSLGAARETAQSVNREEFQLATLEREYQSNRQLYETFLTRSKETSLIGEVQPPVARISDPAVPPDLAVKPQRTNIVLVAALLALLLGALASVAIDRADNTIKGGEDAERRLRSAVLASLPQVDDATRKTMARTFLQNTHSHFAEGIRTARTGVLLSGLDAPHKILMVTSSVPGEGKTTVAINLAFAHAQANKRTLLIDCDMRRGQASRALGLGAAKKGLTTLVSGRGSIADCVLPVKDTGLYMLPVGDTPPNPLELLHSQKFKDVLDELAKDFPMIIIDSPPVELVSEALVLAPMVTNIALVVRAMSTPAPLVRKTQQRLQRAGGQILGVIVNGLDFKAARHYYGEYAHSSYSYGYDGYGSGDKTAKGGDTRGKVMEFLKGKLPWKREPADSPDTHLRRVA